MATFKLGILRVSVRPTCKALQRMSSLLHATQLRSGDTVLGGTHLACARVALMMNDLPHAALATPRQPGVTTPAKHPATVLGTPHKPAHLPPALRRPPSTVTSKPTPRNSASQRSPLVPSEVGTQ
jgi:hypothetical protein